jgi:GT2 family glycosyltransferase/glycosyltransferase involved in cell wall biosynthesis
MADLIAIEKGAPDPLLSLHPSQPDTRRIESLLGDIARAIDRKDLSTALRLADRVRRVAPKDRAITLLYARLLVEAGYANLALDSLKGQVGPDILLVRGLALLELGLLPEAAESCASLLHSFSVSAIEGLSLFASRLCRNQGGAYPQGWVGIDDSLTLIGEASRSSRLVVECADGTRTPVKVEDGPDDLAPFSCRLSPEASGPVRILADDSELLGSGLSWPPDFMPSAWTAVENDVLLGEAQLGWSPKLRLHVEVSNSDGSTLRTVALAPNSPGKDAAPDSSSFSAVLLPHELSAGQLNVAVVLPDGRRIGAVGSPLFPGRRHPAPLLENWPRLPADSPPGANSSPGLQSPGIIDIVIPVYAGLRETLDCLRSVLETTSREHSEVIVVDDASPDRELCEALTSLAAQNQITLLTNPRNLGFAGSVNRAIQLHPDRDVILLNSDTLVFGDWTQRLARAALKSPDIGTVTPLGENGSITDYQRDGDRSSASAEAIDRAASQANSGMVIDIPVGVGFCMYVKRKCIDQTGNLDASTFGRGYGEENDFCLRARNLGWRHAAAADVFVAHQGGRSFGEHADSLRKRNSRVLDALYPGYSSLIAAFSAEDPLLEARRSIDRMRLLASARKPVLMITHDLQGGVQRHIRRREADLSAAGHTVVVLQRRAARNSKPMLSLAVGSMGLDNLIFALPEDLASLEQLLRDLHLSHIELHHFFGLPPEILQTIAHLDAPFDAYIHDYAWICPRVALVDGSGKYCGEPRLADCERCVQINGSALEESITVLALRDRSAELFRAARRVIAPSSDARERLARYFPQQNFETTPWELVTLPGLRAPLASAGRVRVAVIGAIGTPKGYGILLACARDAAARDLNLEFVVIGHTEDDQSLLDTGRVFVTGPYEEHEVATLLQREACDIAFFPSVTPETWCYSLTHAMTRGLPIIAFDLGAQAERLRSYPAAELLPLSLNAQQVNYALVHWDRAIAAPAEKRGHEPDQLQVIERYPGEESSRNLSSSAEVLKLPEGIYSFTVGEGGPHRDLSESLALPALQVGVAPGSIGGVEFLTGSSTEERWLAYKTDLVVLRISGGDGSILLTSLQTQESGSLAVNVERLTARASSLATLDLASLDEDDLLAQRQAFDSLDVRLMAHIRYVGDLDFAAGCAGWAGQQLWIEGFAVAGPGDLPPNSIEYRGVAANGLQTPWLSGQALCGSRGEGMPLLGFAVRLKPALSERYTCVYDGRFLSGTRVGPFENGELCSSDLPGDPLEAIELRIVQRQLQTTPTFDPAPMPAYG